MKFLQPEKFFQPVLMLIVVCLWTVAIGCKGPLPRLSLSPDAKTPDEAAMLAKMQADEDAANDSGDDVQLADASDSIKLASASDREPMTFTDSTRLQYGCGPMDEGAPRKFEMTGSGLRYRVLRASKGRKPTAKSSVTVNYRGWLDSGKEFDSSYDRGESISFPLNGVIPGWTEGMQLVGEGGMIELWVPARLGYGREGSGGSVPPNATLHFVVELIKVQ